METTDEEFHNHFEKHYSALIEFLKISWQKRRNFIIIVIFPLLFLSFYFAFMASDQYESEAHFVVRSDGQNAMPATGLTQMMGALGSSGGSQTEGVSVNDYLQSHDVVAKLQSQLNLVAMFRRPEADIFSRLWFPAPTPEMLLKYYLKHVKVKYETETGITNINVRAFRPKDAYLLAETLLKLGEKRVNDMNKRRYDSAVGIAKTQLEQAEDKIAEIQLAITHFRRGDQDLDPRITGETQIKLVSQLTAQLEQARAQFDSMKETISPESPQYIALKRQVVSLEAVVNKQRNLMTSGHASMVTGLGSYEELRIRQEFAAKRYESAAASLVKASETAMRQKLFIIRVVEPNMPVKSTYPKPIVTIAGTALVLMLIYAIGWLIIAGTREHAA
ncbi:MAG: lipopolysaccharide biosynthesis protein [Zymomonas mobilis]|uniref:Capsular polysaccharide transport system permease protein n=1 Tax=Zymomonas mobilis TaxID=542 RepID=A0A542W196_ZYMMB|nr:lipopolysaccharide biosynthesis protein [Zymomonas mobilis]TQL17323.1 capsular polysaccharide transport system permease protein [Zymomonas mobilis]